MLALWTYVEADFQRDYGLDLSETLCEQSWRRFNALLEGLSPYGSVALNARRVGKEQREREEREGTRKSDGAAMFWRHVATTGRVSKNENENSGT